MKFGVSLPRAAAYFAFGGRGRHESGHGSIRMTCGAEKFCKELCIKCCTSLGLGDHQESRLQMRWIISDADLSN